MNLAPDATEPSSARFRIPPPRTQSPKPTPPMYIVWGSGRCSSMMGHGKRCGAALHSVPLLQSAYILWIVSARPEGINKSTGLPSDTWRNSHTEKDIDFPLTSVFHLRRTLFSSKDGFFHHEFDLCHYWRCFRHGTCNSPHAPRSGCSCCSMRYF